MSQTTYETITADALRAQHDHYWSGALTALNTPQLGDGDVVHPVSHALPYHAAFTAYARHMDSCTQCSAGSLYDQCPEGDALSTIAADACAAQEDLAVQN